MATKRGSCVKNLARSRRGPPHSAASSTRSSHNRRVRVDRISCALAKLRFASRPGISARAGTTGSPARTPRSPASPACCCSWLPSSGRCPSPPARRRPRRLRNGPLHQLRRAPAAQHRHLVLQVLESAPLTSMPPTAAPRSAREDRPASAISAHRARLAVTYRSCS